MSTPSEDTKEIFVPVPSIGNRLVSLLEPFRTGADRENLSRNRTDDALVSTSQREQGGLQIIIANLGHGKALEVFGGLFQR